MDYITSKKRKNLTNEPYILSTTELKEMLLQNKKDIEETRRVTESSKRGETYYSNDVSSVNDKICDLRLAFFKEIIYRDRKTDGFLMQYPHALVIHQGEHNSYYRGENQIYDLSQPTLFRLLSRFNENERKLYCFIASMRIVEFQLFLNKLKIVQFWLHNYGTVLYESLAQHYGLETEWLDITSDLEVALFFATCKYDKESKQWYPLTKADIERSKKTQYGVIFHIPGWQADLMLMNLGLAENYMDNIILPIGYQPFMRCHCQHGYGIHMKQPNPLQENLLFEKLWFRHDEKFSKEIYEKMDCGKKIYPQEGLVQFNDVIEEIKKTTHFSKAAYSIALEKNELSNTEIHSLMEECDCVKIFGNEIIISEEEPIKVSRQRIRAFNRKYERFSIEKDYGIKLFCRPVFIPNS